MISLFDRPHAEARALVSSGAPVFLFVNPVEFHGPHLPLHTDTLISHGLAKDLFSRLLEVRPTWPFLLGSELSVGVEPTPGPGSRPVPYPTVRASVVEACRALHQLGAERVVLMTFHGNPLHSLALDAGIRFLKRRGVRAVAPLHLLLRMLVELNRDDLEQYRDAVSHVPDAELQKEVLDQLPLDFHAGFFETSLALHYAPDSVAKDYVRLPPCPPIRPNRAVAAIASALDRTGAKSLAREIGFAAQGLGWFGIRPFPGYTGQPHLASPAAGSVLAKLIIDSWFEPVRRVLLEGAPAPAAVMPWTAWLTLGGRLGGTSIADEQIVSMLPEPSP